MLMSCFFNGVPCKSTNFITFESPSYGGCYAFNAMMKNLPNGGTRDSNEGGGDGILELRLYAHSHQYVPNLSDVFDIHIAVGIMIMVHDNTQLSLIDIADMASGPGRKHKLSFTRKKSYFLSLPYAKCTNQIPLAMQAMFNLFQDADYAYSQLLCFTNCIQSYTYHVCGCVNPDQWLARFVVLFGTDIVVDAPLSPPEWMMSSIRDFVETSSVSLPSDWSTAWRSHIQSNYIAIDIVRGKEFKHYAQQVVKNAKQLVKTLSEKGYTFVAGGTDTHLALLDLRPLGLDGAKVERVLEVVSIAVNKNTCPGDKSALKPSGIRLGTPALTTRGFQENDIIQVALFIDRAVQIALEIYLINPNQTLKDFKDNMKLDQHAKKLNELKQEIEEFASKFPMPGYESI
ncbi:unnamed protein product [Rotaria sp. Silwood1]|nr:unnamed protein product [Rotaria sp. Silwood1]